MDDETLGKRWPLWDGNSVAQVKFGAPTLGFIACSHHGFGAPTAERWTGNPKVVDSNSIRATQCLTQWSEFTVFHLIITAFFRKWAFSKELQPGSSTLSFPIKWFWSQLLGAPLRTLSVRIAYTPLPVLLLCGRLPNRDELFFSVCYIFLGVSRSYQTPIYAASEHLHPDLYKLLPFVAVAGLPTTWTEIPAA